MGNNTQSLRIGVVIPVHNEASFIAALVKEIKALKLDVIVIDDGSMDNSGGLAQAAGAVVLRHDTRQGKGFSLREGFDYILRNNYDAVITMDGDGQHSVADIEKFIAKAQQTNAPIVNGNRMAAPTGMPVIRFLTNKIMSAFISAVCKQHIPDSQCGYRYIARVVLETITFSSSDFEIESEVLMKASKNGFRIAYVPVKTIYLNEESKINPLKDTVRFITYVIREMRSPKSSP